MVAGSGEIEVMLGGGLEPDGDREAAVAEAPCGGGDALDPGGLR